MTAPFDQATLAIIGAPVPLLEGIMQSSSGAARLSGSASALAYVPGEPAARRLVWVDREGRVEPILAPPPRSGATAQTASPPRPPRQR
jgi:hypothetical protein